MTPVSDHGLPHASVVVAARDAAATLGDCVASLLALDYPADRLDVIVVDNDSHDDTARVIAGFGARVTGVHELRRGAAAARNRGLAAVQGPIVAFTDADCTVDRGWLRALAAALDDTAVGVSGGAIRAYRPATSMERFVEELHDHAVAMREKPPYAITMSWASRTAVLRDLGGFDARLLRGQDVDLAWRVVRAGYRLRYVAEAVVYHRNPATFADLFRQGYLHGRGESALRRIHAAHLAAAGAALHPVRRLARDVARFRHVRSLRPALYRLVFDLGKVCGGLAGEPT